MLDPILLEMAGTAAGMHRGVVVNELEGDGLDVLIEGVAVRCRRLVTTTNPCLLSPGDEVLVWRPSAGTTIVLGRIGSSTAESRARELEDELVLEARHSLILRVGEGSITIREDGKILIKGKDLVSHAQRTNRIKGGAVSIN